MRLSLRLKVSSAREVFLQEEFAPAAGDRDHLNDYCGRRAPLHQLDVQQADNTGDVGESGAKDRRLVGATARIQNSGA